MNVKELCRLPGIVRVYGVVTDHLFGLRSCYAIPNTGGHTVLCDIHMFQDFLSKFFMHE